MEKWKQKTFKHYTYINIPQNTLKNITIMRIICELTEWAEQREGGSIGREGLQAKATD